MTSNGLVAGSNKSKAKGQNMKVAMLRTAAGPEWIAPRGRVVDVPDETGKAWVEQGAARKYVHEEDSKKTFGFKSRRTPTSDSMYHPSTRWIEGHSTQERAARRRQAAHRMVD